MHSCLSNHTALLMLLAARSEVTTRDLAISLGITERAVHRILKDLARQGYISIGKNGYRNTYKLHPQKSLGHPSFPSITLGDLIGPLTPRLIKLLKTKNSSRSVRLVAAPA
ncbi:MAG TPA: HTH domain-containing protein [Chloroflexota bacterium]|nr:HTH domain-containing protein [Chloroflexota bacterium]